MINGAFKLNNPPQHFNVIAHIQTLVAAAAVHGDNQLIRSNQGFGVLLKDPSTGSTGEPGIQPVTFRVLNLFLL